MSLGGLQNHQSRKSNKLCHRGRLREERDLHTLNKKYDNKYGPLPKPENHISLFEKHRKGQPFDAGDKRCCLNLVQYLMDTGSKRSNAIYKTSEILGISTKHIYR